MPINYNSLKNGLWYSQYLKIYTLGGTSRVAELSTYPRAYKDTDPHVYTEDVPFIVTEEDVNTEDGEYRDGKGELHKVGSQAIHYAGDDLPGGFPLWLESETLPVPPMGGKPHEFLLVLEAILGQLVKVHLEEVYIKKDDQWVELDTPSINRFRGELVRGMLSLPRKTGDSDRQIILIKYKRVIRG